MSHATPPLVENLHRLGTETAFTVLARAHALAREGHDVINLGIGQPDFKTPPHVVEAAIKALRDGHHGYTDSKGILELREAVARMLNTRYKTTVPVDQVLITPGGKVAMWFAINALGDQGGEILYPNPAFPIYESAIHYSGAKAVPYTLKEETGFAFDAQDILNKITDKTRLIIVNSPANPTGGVVPRPVIDALVAGLADRPDIFVLSDEIYSRILYDGREHVSLLTYPELQDRLILLEGWSKTYAMTGWRLGFSVWPTAMIEPLNRLAINIYSCTNAAAQYGALAALEGPQDFVDEMCRAFDERRRIIVAGLNELPGVSCVDPGGAFYAFANITGTGKTAQALQSEMLEKAYIATIAGTSFGAFGEGYLRFSYAASSQDIEKALARLGDLLA
ncbi:MAG: pyridoxal phosphate-dependent aminotransferase [Pseudomonadota bacterium]